MPPKRKAKAKKPETTSKQKQKQSQKQVVNVTINNDKKSGKKKSNKQSSSSSSQSSHGSRQRGNPTSDMIYRNAAFNRPINYNIVPELPLTGNQLITEMRQLMNAHTKEIERTPLQMTEDVRRNMMKKADGIVQNTMETQTEYPKEKVDAANKIKAQIRQKISSDAVESIIEDEIDRVRQRPRTRAAARNSRVRIETRPNVTLEEYRNLFPGGTEPSMTSGGYLRRGTKEYNAYLAKKRG